MLSIIALLLGFAIAIKHLLALLAPALLKAFLQRFPRSHFWGKLLFMIALIGAFFLVLTTDLGEFSSLRRPILLSVIVGGGLFGWLVPDFLSIRSLGCIALLAARPLLETTFLQSGLLPLLLSLLAYAWVIIALFCVGMPYLFRNFVTWITASAQTPLWNLLSWVGLLYGIVLFLLGGWQLLNL